MNITGIDDYNRWSTLKIELNANHSEKYFKEGEIWWCHVGLNIGHESNGKGILYTRPVLILKKLNKYNCLCLPMTTKSTNKVFSHEILFKDIKSFVLLQQIKMINSKRLQRRMGSLPQNKLKIINQKIQQMLDF